MIPGIITSWRKTYSCFRNKLVGMDIVVDDEWIALKKIGSFQGHAQVIYLSVLHV
jgi:hypothetical protein